MLLKTHIFKTQEEAITAWVNDYNKFCGILGPGNIRAKHNTFTHNYEIFSPSMDGDGKDRDTYVCRNGCNRLQTKIAYGEKPVYRCDKSNELMLQQECCFGVSSKCYCSTDIEVNNSQELHVL